MIYNIKIHITDLQQSLPCTELTLREKR